MQCEYCTRKDCCVESPPAERGWQMIANDRPVVPPVWHQNTTVPGTASVLTYCWRNIYPRTSTVICGMKMDRIRVHRTVLVPEFGILDSTQVFEYKYGTSTCRMPTINKTSNENLLIRVQVRPNTRSAQ